MAGKILYTPFISKRIPESSALSPIPISLPISEYRGTNPDREVIPIQYVPEIKEVDTSQNNIVENPMEWSRLVLKEQKKKQSQDQNKESVTFWTPTLNEYQKSAADRSINYIEVPTTEGKIYSDRKEFKKDLKEAYEKELAARGLPTEFADYIGAQDALESSWGKSSLSKHFNFGGIKETRKGRGVDKKTKESYNGKDLEDVIQSFRQFNSLEDYVKYKIDLLGNSNFNVFAYRPDQMYSRLVSAKNKYATDPNYLNKMLKMHKSWLAT